MKKISIFILFLSFISTSAFSQPTQLHDKNGKLILQKNEDGSVSTYSYNKPGNRTVNTSKEQEINFDKKGRTAVKSKKKTK